MVRGKRMKKTIIRIVLMLIVLTMILPTNSFHLVTDHEVNTSTLLASSASEPANEVATANDGKNVYKAWVDGGLHYTKIYFQTSKDGGTTWSDSKPITDETYTPVSVELLKDKNTVHLIWEDGTYREFTTYYMKSSDGGATWSKPVNAGFKNPKMVLDNSIIYILSTMSDRKMSISRSTDEGNTFTQIEPDIGFSSFTNDIIVNDGCIHIAFSGGIRDPETGVHNNMGIYCAFSKDGSYWDNAVKVSDVENPVNSVSIKNKNNLFCIKWTEEKEREHVTYMKTSLNGISWNKKEIVELVEVPQQNQNPTVSSGTKSAEKADKEWTFICYLDADNNLNSYGIADANEMEQVGSTADINIVVLFDGSSNGDSKAYYIQQDADTGTITSPQIPLTSINASWGTELNMGNPQTCIDFVKYVYNNYPAKHYAIDFWNHGGSWKYGMTSDDTNGDDFTMQEVRTIYEKLRVDTGRKLLWDVMGMDECLMSDIEVAYDAKQYVDYICNSEDSIGGDGWEYNLVLQHIKDQPTMNPETFAYWIYKEYVNFYGVGASYTTMSVINTTEFDYTLMPAINNLGQKLKHKAKTLNSNIATAATNSASWQGYDWNRDLVHFAQNLQSQIPVGTDADIYNAAQLIINLGAANTAGDAPWNGTWNHSKSILCHNTNSNENGITIYCSGTSYDTVYDTLKIVPETSWDEAVKAIFANTADYPNKEPFCSITSPTQGSAVTLNTVVTITGTANDSGDGGTVQKVEVKIDKEAWQTATGTTSWSCNWNTAGFAPGKHRITVRSFDGTDYSATWSYVTVNLITDPTLPDLAVTNISFSIASSSKNEFLTSRQPKSTLYTYHNYTTLVSDMQALNSTYPSIFELYTAQALFGLPNVSYGSENYKTWIIRITNESTGFNKPEVLFIGGHHGDETVGVEAAYYYAELLCTKYATDSWIKYLVDNREIYIMPCVNPYGWAHLQRYDENGNDMNRDYPFDYSGSAPFSTIGARAVHELTKRHLFINTVSWHGGAEGIYYAWGCYAHDTAPYECPDDIAFYNEGKKMSEYGGPYTDGGTNYYVYGKANEILYACYGAYEDYAYAASWDTANENSSYPTNGCHSLTHCIEMSEIKNPAASTLGGRADIFTPGGAEDGYVPKNIRIALLLTDIAEPYINITCPIPQVALPEQIVTFKWKVMGALNTTETNIQWGNNSDPIKFYTNITSSLSGDTGWQSAEYSQDIKMPSQPGDYYFVIRAKVDNNMLNQTTPDPSNTKPQSLYVNMRTNASWNITNGENSMQGKTNWYSKIIHIKVDTTFQVIEGYLVKINATISNVNTNASAKNATGVEVGFYDGDPGSGGVLIGIASIPGNITPGGFGYAEIVWNTSMLAGYHTIYVVADPNYTVAEITDDNNTATKDIIVSGYAVALSCSAGEKKVPAGASAVYLITVKNTGALTDTINLTIQNPNATWSASLDAYEVTLAAQASRDVNLTVTSPGGAPPNANNTVKVIGTSQGNTKKTANVSTLTTIIPAIVLIDDESGTDETYYKAALDANSYKYDYVAGPTQSTGWAGFLMQYKIVIWFISGSSSTLTSTDQQNLATFLDSGGKLLVCGEDIGYNIGTSGTGESGFIANYLHADYIADNAGVSTITGVASDPISNGFSGISITGSYPSEIALYDSYASKIFTYTGTTKIAALKADTGIYKVVYFACEYFEGGDSAANKATIMDRIMKWFEPVNDVSVKSIDYPADSGKYQPGTQYINATVINNGRNAQSNFNASCKIEEVTQPEQVTTVFSDGFETDLSKWTVSPSGKWVRSTAYANSGSYSAKCLYDANNTNYNLTSQNIDLTGTSSAKFEYYFRGSSESTYDYLYVEIKRTTDTTWSILTQYTGTTYNSSWNKGSFDISSYVGSTVQIKFRFHTDVSILSGIGWYVDDVVVSKVIPPVTQLVFNTNQTVTTSLVQYATKQVSWNYNFQNTTKYIITVKTWLSTDESKGNDAKSITVTIVQMFTFNLEQGWNYISLPLNTSYKYASDLANNISTCTHIRKWDSAAQSWMTYEKVTGVNNFTLENGVGYWVYTTSAADFTTEGTKISMQTISLNKGWNSIGWTNDTSTTASGLASKIENCTAVAYWNSTLGRYVTYITGSNLSDFKIEKGMACFVYVTSAGVWKNG